MLISYYHIAQRLLLGRTIPRFPLNEALNGLYCSSNIIWVMKSGRMRWAGHVTRVGTGEVATEFWWGNPIGRPMRRWEDNSKMDFQEVNWKREQDRSGSSRICALFKVYSGESVWKPIGDTLQRPHCLSNPSDRTMALGSTQPLTEMSTRSISWR